MATNQKIEPLQLLRGLAAMLIFFKHTLYEIETISPIDFYYGHYKYYTVGIDIFFVISGFIMMYISYDKRGVQAAKNFMLNRFIRIVPLYWFYTLAIVAIALIMPQVLGKAEFSVSSFIQSMLFIPYINSVGDVQPILANGWTLNYEMYFYAIFALCLLLPARYGFPILVIYFLSSVVTSFFYLPESVIGNYYCRPIVLEFLAGSIIGWLFIKNIRLPAWFFTIGLAAVGLVTLAALSADILEKFISFQYFKPISAILIVTLLTLPKMSERKSIYKPFVVLGDISYTLYLAHPFAIGAVTQGILLLGWEKHLNPWAIFAFIVLVTVIGSLIAYRIIEKPLLSFTKGLVYKKKQ